MDRFIGNRLHKNPLRCEYLKSNMDRFIAFALNVWESAKGDLKSNMDRFIDDGFSSTSGSSQI